MEKYYDKVYAEEEQKNQEIAEESKANEEKAEDNKTTEEDVVEENNEAEENSTAVEWFTPDLEDKITNMVDGITLVFVEEGSSKGKLNKLVSKVGKVVSFEKKKPTELASWLVVYALSKGVTISKDNAKYLIEVCGSDKILITNEIEKLISYTARKTAVMVYGIVPV